MHFFSSFLALFYARALGQEPINSPSCSYSITTPSCSVPSSCIASATAASFQSVSLPIESRFFPLDPIEVCKVEAFCRKNAPGAYCYIPAGEALSRPRCQCLPAAFVECPFGVLNACRRGFVCAQAVDSLGIPTATCTRLATATTMAMPMLTTIVQPTTLQVVRPSSTLIVISSTVYNENPSGKPYVVATSIPFTTKIQYQLSTVLSQVTTQWSQQPTSLPITLEPRPLVTISVTNCAGASTISMPQPLAGEETGLAGLVCRGPYALKTTEPFVFKCMGSEVTRTATGASSVSSSVSASTSSSISEFPFTLTSTIRGVPTAVTTTPYVVTTVAGQVTTIYPSGLTISTFSPSATTTVSLYPFGP
jgi:hypothetical protein